MKRFAFVSIGRKLYTIDNSKTEKYIKLFFIGKIMVKICFIPPLFLSGICFSDVFSDYKTFFFYGVSLGNT